MTTKLDKPLKREVDIKGVTYTVTFSPDGIKIVPKGKRNGQDVTWDQLVSGETSLASGLRNSLADGEGSTG
jgi:hypothetical protein